MVRPEGGAVWGLPSLLTSVEGCGFLLTSAHALNQLILLNKVLIEDHEHLTS